MLLPKVHDSGVGVVTKSNISCIFVEGMVSKTVQYNTSAFIVVNGEEHQTGGPCNLL